MDIDELLDLLKNAESTEEIDEYRGEIEDLMPSVALMFDFDQQNYAHQYDLWTHCLQTVVNLSKGIDDDMVYLAALVHDIGKPFCQTEDEKDGKINMHYYGHPEKSAEIVENEVIPEILRNNRLTEDEQNRLVYYVKFHDDRVSLRMKHLRKHLNIGATLQEFKNLMQLQIADAKAHIIIPVIQERIDICTQLSGEYANTLYNEIMKEKNRSSRDDDER